jgi:hypothetical protein
MIVARLARRAVAGRPASSRPIVRPPLRDAREKSSRVVPLRTELRSGGHYFVLPFPPPLFLRTFFLAFFFLRAWAAAFAA